MNELKELQELKQEMKEIKEALSEYGKITNKIFDNINLIIRYLYDCDLWL